MQDYIRAHLGIRRFRLRRPLRTCGVLETPRRRVFREFLGETPLEYVKKIRLTDSVRKLWEKGASVLEIALDSGFDSHEGYMAGLCPLL